MIGPVSHKSYVDFVSHSQRQYAAEAAKKSDNGQSTISTESKTGSTWGILNIILYVPSLLLSTVFWFADKIFSCFGLFESSAFSKVAEIKTMIVSINSLQQLWANEAEDTPEFKEKWKAAFNALPKKLQLMIIKEDIATYFGQDQNVSSFWGAYDKVEDEEQKKILLDEYIAKVDPLVEQNYAQYEAKSREFVTNLYIEVDNVKHNALLQDANEIPNYLQFVKHRLHNELEKK